ncbi:MAG: hypothetical protein JW908_12065 [Anaerolineales bacterium]|nr:hypothetical protein [Anaerolineales bacterium]
MKSSPAHLLIVSFVIIISLACGTSVSTPPPDAEPDTQATIDAAVAATAHSEASLQATIEAGIAATTTALPPQPTSIPAEASTLFPTPTPSVEYIVLTEEELAALVEQSVNDAVTASEQASAATAQATSDNTLTPEEVAAMEAYYLATEEAIYLAEEAIGAYYDLYADLATETLELLIALEEDLSAVAQNTAALEASLQLISDTLNQGAALAQETIDQLNQAAQQTNVYLTEAQTQAQNWATSLQSNRDDRAQNALAVQPDNVAGDVQSALANAFGFVDGIHLALEDNKLTHDELNGIALLGANASAGLNAQGGPKLQGLSEKINTITMQLARGQVPQAKNSLGDFEALLGKRPANLPPITLPSNLPRP